MRLDIRVDKFYCIDRKQNTMSKRQTLELRLLMMVLVIINRFFCRYNLRISNTTAKVNTENPSEIFGVDDIEIIDNPKAYLRLGVADLVELHNMLNKDQRILRHLTHSLVFKNEVIYKDEERGQKNRTRHFICLEKQKEGGWLVKVLAEDFVNANPDKYKVACLIKH